MLNPVYLLEHCTVPGRWSEVTTKNLARDNNHPIKTSKQKNRIPYFLFARTTRDLAEQVSMQPPGLRAQYQAIAFVSHMPHHVSVLLVRFGILPHPPTPPQQIASR